MQPIVIEHRGKEMQVLCLHWRTWPPIAVLTALSELGPDVPLDQIVNGLRLTQNDPEYQRMMVWLRTCGLKRMDPEKCVACPLVRRIELRSHNIPYLVTLDGRQATRATMDDFNEARTLYQKSVRQESSR